jgi:SAM-dependent methyltransferase
VTYERYGFGRIPASGEKGWDAWADDYATLSTTSPTYALGKEILHAAVDRVCPLPSGREAWALDFNCGAGDDLARLVARGWRAVGCDGSAGMIQAAARRSPDALKDGRVELWWGHAEDLTEASFDGRRFDLVFSTTGGFAYVDDELFVRLHRALASMLLPGGVLVIAHLTRFCAVESLFHLSHLRVRRAIERWSGRVPVTIRGEAMVMRLRSPGHIRRLLDGVVALERVSPLLWCVPPFQSGWVPRPRALTVARALERITAQLSAFAMVADQVICVARPLRTSSNRAR